MDAPEEDRWKSNPSVFSDSLVIISLLSPFPSVQLCMPPLFLFLGGASMELAPSMWPTLLPEPWKL